MNMLKIIVNADDLGISGDVNSAIAECFAERFITSTTLMVNMDYADEAVAMAVKYGWHERVGLHLNLTSGVPLTDRIKRFRRFCARDGSFNASFAKNLYTRMHLSKEELQAVREEAEAQIVKYISYGLPDKHLDSHHHVHTDASVWKAIEPLILSYGIRSVRISRNLYRRISFAKGAYKARYNRKLRTLPVDTADYFGSFKDFTQCREDIGDGALVEIMVHPMYDEGRLVDRLDRVKPIEEEKEYLSRIKHIKDFY
ncbi:MAG: ChbG/HpnK family deacetylase [Lachnospiraceae bacterium]|nr:ChbG/HpnK family deacetylase [Lachnospiraceae bacterium]